MNDDKEQPISPEDDIKEHFKSMTDNTSGLAKRNFKIWFPPLAELTKRDQFRRDARAGLIRIHKRDGNTYRFSYCGLRGRITFAEDESIERFSIDDITFIDQAKVLWLKDDFNVSIVNVSDHLTFIYVEPKRILSWMIKTISSELPHLYWCVYRNDVPIASEDIILKLASHDPNCRYYKRKVGYEKFIQVSCLDDLNYKTA